ncbi:ubiquitin-specific protease ubp2 [Scheffersomyces spartinae]|uniref:Ubiquitin carboxyl-terminal hydrolase 2 n=1 Tax=Scheffersomyces spartinae TaxID=45513 RepID=A0A9P8AIN7_9ASCO|nr:ubiquitin-specific protease ubp2 [Scheffersomyces spartinae]KAG7194024.1 ubiquitin-specific protease ubp2 [Scheffersomyces spartinae]
MATAYRQQCWTPPRNMGNPLESDETIVEEVSRSLDSELMSPPAPPPPPSRPATKTTNDNEDMTIDRMSLLNSPFKTLNRIIDDIKWTYAYKSQYGSSASLLNAKPIDYAQALSDLARDRKPPHMLTLNNKIPIAPTVETVDHYNPETPTVRSKKSTVVRGLVQNGSHVCHFRIVIVELLGNPFKSIDKHEYHIVHSLQILDEDLKLLKYEDATTTKLDDAFFKSANSPNDHILRCTVFPPEFSTKDQLLLFNEDVVRERFLLFIEANPKLDLSADHIPSTVYIIKTFIKVLRGPIVQEENNEIKTISIKQASLDAFLDLNYLVKAIGATISNDVLTPPRLSATPALKESYIRKIFELIFYARTKARHVPDNEFVTNYSFADNMDPFFKNLNEVDAASSRNYFAEGINSTQLPFLVKLSVSEFYNNELTIKCFENTVKSDLINRFHYVDALKNTVNYLSQYNEQTSPKNNKLTQYYYTLAQRGELVGYSDYLDSLKAIGIQSTVNPDTIDDDVLIAMYQASYTNDPKNYQYFRQNAGTIAKVRNSVTFNKYLLEELVPVNIAMSELNIQEITEDEVVLTAYEFKLDEVMQSNGFDSQDKDILFLHESLLSIGVNRKSNIIMNYIETKLPDYSNQSLFCFTYVECLDKLKCSPSSSEFEILTNFQKLLAESEDLDICTLRFCLRTIAENKKSDILFNCLKTGKLDSSLLPVSEWPAGLDNIGNTCYLNSLLQYYFCILPLRDTILNFDEGNFKLSPEVERKIGGRKVEQGELERSNQFMYHLQDLFNQMIYTLNRCVVPSKELAYLSFLPLSQPVLFQTRKEITESIKLIDSSSSDDMDQDDDDEGNSAKIEPITVSTQSPDIIIADEDHDTSLGIKEEETSCNPEIIDLTIEDDIVFNQQTPFEEDVGELGEKRKILPIEEDQMENTIEIGRQQDVTECIENVTYQIETTLEPESQDNDGEQHDLIKRLFSGKIKQTITPLNDVDKKRISEERFFSLIINVGDHPKNIYDSLDTYFNDDIVSLEEGEVRKSITISQLPEILQFHVQRVLFDRERLMAYKSLETIPFSDKIYLDRYLDTEDPVTLRKRNEVFQWKSEINGLNSQKALILNKDKESNLSLIDSLIATKKFLEARIEPHPRIGVNPSTIIALQQQIDDLKNKLLSINKELEGLEEKVRHQFEDYNKVGYSIFAIFIHRGEASYGHYWVYIKDPHRNIYRKYNDEMVTEVSVEEVFNFTEGNTATPYYIVYVREDKENDYIQPLKRNPT